MAQNEFIWGIPETLWALLFNIGSSVSLIQFKKALFKERFVFHFNN